MWIVELDLRRCIISLCLKHDVPCFCVSNMFKWRKYKCLLTTIRECKSHDGLRSKNRHLTQDTISVVLRNHNR